VGTTDPDGSRVDRGPSTTSTASADRADRAAPEPSGSDASGSASPETTRETGTPETTREPDSPTAPADEDTTESAETTAADATATATDATTPEPSTGSADTTADADTLDAADESPSPTAADESPSPTAADESPSPTDVDGSPDPSASSAVDDASADELAWEESTAYDRPGGLDLDPGTNLLVQCGSHDAREHEACVDLLGGDRISDKHVLLIRYNRMKPSRLQRIAESAAAVKLLTVGYSQPIPDAVRDAVETIRINNPDDLTRLGIVTTSAISDWDDADVHVCYHSINVPLQYKNQQSVFRFLHIFLNKLSSADAVSHFHIDPSAGGPQTVSAFKPLFDAVVDIDSVGTHLETQ
jgi:hypothetical protein